MWTRSRSAYAAPLAAVWLAAATGCGDDENASAPPETVSATATAQPPPSPPSPAPPATSASAETGGTAPGTQAGDALRFRGNGDRRLPAFRVGPPGTTLQWTNLAEVFSLFTLERTLVDSVAPRGERFLPPGLYRIDVIASGGWEIVVPRARPVR